VEDDRQSAGSVIRVSAVVLRDDAGQVLTVRKRGTERFMLPGGKQEPGETPLEAAVRECSEELGTELDATMLRQLGTFRAPAANEKGFTVDAVVFEAATTLEVVDPAAEIDAARWLDPRQPLPLDLAPLLVEHVIPALRQYDTSAERAPASSSPGC
jgi:8-oxo-dGTP pyrophosphatase MutT (NUDIX family)